MKSSPIPKSELGMTLTVILYYGGIVVEQEKKITMSIMCGSPVRGIL
jgi:hypothetical protein